MTRSPNSVMTIQSDNGKKEEERENSQACRSPLWTFSASSCWIINAFSANTENIALFSSLTRLFSYFFSLSSSLHAFPHNHSLIICLINLYIVCVLFLIHSHKIKLNTEKECEQNTKLLKIYFSMENGWEMNQDVCFQSVGHNRLLAVLSICAGVFMRFPAMWNHFARMSVCIL